MANEFTVGEKVVAGDKQYKVVGIYEGDGGLRYDLREICGEGVLTDVPECLVRPYDGDEDCEEDGEGDGEGEVRNEYKELARGIYNILFGMDGMPKGCGVVMDFDTWYNSALRRLHQS